MAAAVAASFYQDLGSARFFSSGTRTGVNRRPARPNKRPTIPMLTFIPISSSIPQRSKQKMPPKHRPFLMIKSGAIGAEALSLVTAQLDPITGLISRVMTAASRPLPQFRSYSDEQNMWYTYGAHTNPDRSIVP